MEHSRSASLNCMFSPKSIAVLGASASPAKIGGATIKFIKTLGFSGAVYPINPTASEVGGLRTYPSMEAIGKPVDLAICALPAAATKAGVLSACEAGVKGIVIFSSGFAETGDNGRAAQERLLQIAKPRGVRLLGPNCLGFMNVREAVYATFSPAPSIGLARKGCIAVVSQSGAFGAYAYSLARERQLGLSYWITTGNEADLQMSDCVEWLAHEPQTSVIMCYMEGCRDGDRLKHAFKVAKAADKHIIITKVGRTAAGAAAAQSHTAALAGDDEIYNAVFRQHGVYRAATVEEFFHVGYALSIAPRTQRTSVGLLTVSGGVGALMADDAHDRGLEVSPMPEAAQAQLQTWVPFAGARNPVDITGQVTSEPDLLSRTAMLMLDYGGYGSLVAFLAAAGSAEAFWPAITETVRAVRTQHSDVVLVIVSILKPERREELERHGCLVFEDPSHAIRALGGLNFFRAHGKRELPLESLPNHSRVIPRSFNEAQALGFLRANGVPTVVFDIVHSEGEAAQVARSLGVPVAVKVLSADILHKTEVGGIKLNVSSPASAATAYREVTLAAQRARPDAVIDGAVVAAMAPKGIECILGVKRDPIFGPVVLFGFGGVLVEILKDVSLRIAPFGIDDARAMISELRARAVFEGVRGAPPADLEAIVAALISLSRLAAKYANEIESIDINPFLVLPRGQGAIALDAIIVPRTSLIVATSPAGDGQRRS